MSLTSSRKGQLQAFHEVLYDTVLPPIKNPAASSNKHSQERSSSTKAAILNAILRPTPRPPPKGSKPHQRPVRKHNGIIAGIGQTQRYCDDRAHKIESTLSTSNPKHVVTPDFEGCTESDTQSKGSLELETALHTHCVVAPAVHATQAQRFATTTATRHFSMDRSIVQACTAKAQKTATEAGLHAMRIRAAAGCIDIRPPSTPSQRSSTSTSLRSREDTCEVASQLPLLGRCEFALLPMHLLFRVTIFLLPSDVAHIVFSHSYIAEARDELAAWTFYEAYGMSHQRLQAQLELDQLPALRLHRFLCLRAQAAMRAQSQKLAAGLQHSMVVRDGVAVSWGAASSGQLGRGSPAQQFHPIPTAVPLTMPVAMVACGGDHSLLVTTCQTVWAFGRNADGQLGTGNTKDCSRPVEMLVPSAFQVACGADHSLVLAVDSTVWACGRGAEGQLGFELADDEDRSILPLKVHEQAHIVACGADHSLILDGLGHCCSFGENSKGQLGLGHRKNQFRPTRLSLPTNVLVIGADCGGTHTLLLADDAKVYGFGNNEQGQLGIGLPEDVLVPTLVKLKPSGPCIAQRISCGFSHSLVLNDSGSVWAFGGCSRGADVARPWRARGALENVKVEDIAAGGGHALCLALGSVFSFGVASGGQHNDNDERTQSPTPKRVVV